MSSQKTPQVAEPQGVRGALLSRVVAGIFLLALAVAMASQLTLARQRDLETGERMVRSMALAIAQNIGGSVRSIDALLADMAVTVSDGSWTQEESRLRFEGRLTAFPELLWVGVVDSQGNLTAYAAPSLALLPWGLSISDRDYVQAFLGGNPNGGNGGALHVGNPYIGRGTKERTIHLSRAVLKNGAVSGVVVAAVAADYYAQQLDITMLDPEGATAVLRLDGLMLARAPNHPEKFGINVSASDLFKTWLPRAKVDVARLVSRADGNEKLLAYRQLDRYPLVVTSGIAVSTALATWHRMVAVEITGFLLFSLAVIYWASVADIRNTALLRHRETLRQAVAERTADLEKAKALAEYRAEDISALNKKLGCLAQVAAHDLQEPVRRMVSFSQLLRRRMTQLTAETEADLLYIEDGGKRLKEMLEGFRQYTELLSVQPEFSDVPLGECAAVAVGPLSEDISLAGGSVLLDHLPVVRADRSLISLAMARLIDNAWNYRHPQRPVCITISGALIDSDPRRWSLSISDNGQGLPQGMRLDALGLRPVGLGEHRGEPRGGMGLAFCQAVAELHGGSLTAERLAEGTRFTITVQLRDGEQQGA